MRYQYSSQGFRQRFGQNPFVIPSGVKILLIVNIVAFFLIELSGQKNILFQIFGLVPRAVSQEYKLWQTFTYLFVHGGFLHIFFNMFVLWMFGKDLEIDWGKNEFLIFYFICGIGAGLITVLISMNSFIPIVGASGAVYGVLVAYGFTYPNRMVYLYGLFPLKVKYMVLGLGLISFLASLSTLKSTVSHITHLSGMMIGIIYILYNFKWKNIRLWLIKIRLQSIQNKKNDFENNDNKIKMQVDKILDKLNDHGWESLTVEEEDILTKSSKHFFNKRPQN